MLTTLLTVFFVIVSVLLVFMVVITPSQEGGLASAFGGMGADSFFGTKAHRHINRFTMFLAIAFLTAALVIMWRNRPEPKEGDGSGGDRSSESAPAPENP